MKPPVQVDVIAKAEATFSLKGEIPKNSLGRLVDSITDIFRPFSEARGLKADNIRLQREEVAIEIAKRARARLAIENQEIKPVDNKVLIPLMEKSSLEDIDDEEMIDRWSSLLANATKAKKVEPRYVQILSELNSRQAQLFEAIATNAWNDFERPEVELEDAPGTLDARWIRSDLDDVFMDLNENLDADMIYERIFLMLDRPGAIIVDILLHRKDKSTYSLNVQERNTYDKRDLDLDILSSLGIIKRADIRYITQYADDIDIYYYHITDLGVSFFKTIDKRPPSDEANVIVEDEASSEPRND